MILNHVEILNNNQKVKKSLKQQWKWNLVFPSNSNKPIYDGVEEVWSFQKPNYSINPSSMIVTSSSNHRQLASGVHRLDHPVGGLSAINKFDQIDMGANTQTSIILYGESEPYLFA